MSGDSVCAVIPAAGKGARLGGDLPKILCPMGDSSIVWDILCRAIAPVVDQLHVVVSPAAEHPLRAHLAVSRPERPVTVGVQRTPRGMGDAIFGAYAAWRDFEHILVVWGDQLSLSRRTLERTVAAQRAAGSAAISLPLTKCETPYVDYVFDAAGERISGVLQSREGDRCRPGGLSDVGVFALSTSGLEEAWRDYARTSSPGRASGEVNFLPFLARLSQVGWTTQRIEVTDNREARGLNTPEDLEFFRRLFAAHV